MKTVGTMLRYGGCVIAALAVSACGTSTLRLHNPADDQTAQSALKAFVDSDLKSSLSGERAAMADFAKREQEIVRRDRIGLRDRNLVAFLAASDVEHSWGALDNEITRRLRQLIGDASSQDSLGQVLESKLKGISIAQNGLDTERPIYSLASGGKVVLGCPVRAEQRPSPDQKSLVVAIQSFDRYCRDLLAEKAELDKVIAPGSLLGKANAQLIQIAEERAALDTSLKTANENYADALSKAKNASATDPGALEAAAKSVKETIDKLGVPLAKAGALSGDGILRQLALKGAIYKLTAEKAAIDDLLLAMQQDQQPSSSPELAMVAALSSVDKAVTTTQYPQISVLLLESELLRIEAADLQKKVQRAEERIALMQKKRSALIDEAVFLGQGKRALDTYGKRPGCKKEKSLYEEYKRSPNDCKSLIAETLLGFANAQTLGRMQEELIDYQLIAQLHDAVLDDSETALALTDNLIRVPLQQLSRLYAGGVKPEDLTNLIQALGLSAIAVNVK